ncbi:interleukin-1 beta [Plectropomus leopardus]|uniref:interleukin-1 beta n=1 Tax=Plectropomus leopardus TaxID=160734 RepID=UPI001C4D30C7|nr:interleukin-1 beta [Plectropomus leopardus]
MCDFDLSQALDDSTDCDATGCESPCFNMKEIKDGIFKLDMGLDLVVSHNPKTLQSVALVLLAASRMKKSLSCPHRELRDDELCSAIMSSLVIETIIEKTESSTSSAEKRVYQRVNSGKQYTLCDVFQKHVVQTSGQLQLQAVTLRGGNCERKVNFKLARYSSPTVSADEGQTVLLSLSDKLHICCSMKDDRAVLLLEERNKEGLKSIREDEDMARFLFYRRAKGVSESTFESVRYRGWFISTGDAENQPVEMCQVDAYRYMTFRMN